MIEDSWILGYRSDVLTTIFSMFPLLASDYFYITIIAFGYWTKPRLIWFRSLGLLVLFSTLLNCIFKNIFQISRPDESLYLIHVHDPFGFPSGDVQVALIFWGYIFSKNSGVLRYICFLPVLSVAMSRVYLGVHSICDIVGAIVIGIMVVIVWLHYLEEKFWHKNSNLQYWAMLICVVMVYIIVSRVVLWSPMFPIAVGGLVGFGLSLKWINAHSVCERMSYIRATISLILVLLLTLFLPISKTDTNLLYLSLFIKYLVIIFSIFVVVPKANALFNILKL